MEREELIEKYGDNAVVLMEMYTKFSQLKEALDVVSKENVNGAEVLLKIKDDFNDYSTRLEALQRYSEENGHIFDGVIEQMNAFPDIVQNSIQSFEDELNELMMNIFEKFSEEAAKSVLKEINFEEVTKEFVKSLKGETFSTLSTIKNEARETNKKIREDLSATRKEKLALEKEASNLNVTLMKMDSNLVKVARVAKRMDESRWKNVIQSVLFGAGIGTFFTISVVVVFFMFFYQSKEVALAVQIEKNKEEHSAKIQKLDEEYAKHLGIKTKDFSSFIKPLLAYKDYITFQQFDNGDMYIIVDGMNEFTPTKKKDKAIKLEFKLKN